MKTAQSLQPSHFAKIIKLLRNATSELNFCSMTSVGRKEVHKHLHGIYNMV
jgi:hypothetical protein